MRGTTQTHAISTEKSPWGGDSNLLWGDSDNHCTSMPSLKSNAIQNTSSQLFLPLWGHGVTGAYSSGLRARDSVHPGQIASLSRGLPTGLTYKEQQPFTCTFTPKVDLEEPIHLSSKCMCICVCAWYGLEDIPKAITRWKYNECHIPRAHRAEHWNTPNCSPAMSLLSLFSI